jgi:HK97 family phage prohead protease
MDRMEVKFASEGIDAKTGEFAGYGAVFGNIDSHGDVIMPGAFDGTLKEWGAKGAMPPMRLMHGSAGNPFTGDNLPIGVWTAMREDGRGLYVEGKLSALNTDYGQRIYGLMMDKALNGLSVGYKAKQFTRGVGPSQPKRSLQEMGLIEVSLVDQPSNDRSRVTAIKSAEEIKTIREFEDFLRDVGGYSHSSAKAIALGGFKAADPRDEDANAIMAAIRRNISSLVSKD